MEAATELPLVIFRLSSTVLLALAIRNEFFCRKDIYLLPYFVVILTFVSVVCLLQGAFIDNIEWIHTGGLTLATATALSLSSILRH
jgi:hypothetical protein